MRKKGKYIKSAEPIPEQLLIVSQFFWPEPIGTPLYVTDFARWFAARESKVTVLTGRPYYPNFRLMLGYEAGQRDRESLDNITIFRTPTYVPTSGKALNRVLNEVVFFFGALLRLVTRKVRRSNVVISFCPSIIAALVGEIAKHRHGKHIAVMHDIQSGLAAGLGMVGSHALIRVMQFVERIVLNRVDSIIVLSEGMKKVLQTQGVCKPIEVLPIWVDIEKIYPIPANVIGAPIVLYSGNFGRKQGLEQVLALAEVLLIERPYVRIRLRGSGSQLDIVQKQIQERELKNVELGPLIPLENLNEGLAEGNIHLVPQNPNAADFAMPSKVYGIMAAGRPFVCTATPGSALWALQEETGALICTPPNNARALCDAVISLLDDPDLCVDMGARGRIYVEQQAARDVVLRKYAQVLKTSKSDRKTSIFQ